MATATEGNLEMLMNCQSWSCVSITSTAFPANTTHHFNTKSNPDPNTNSNSWFRYHIRLLAIFSHSAEYCSTIFFVRCGIGLIDRLSRTLFSLFWSMFGLVSVDSVEIKYPTKELHSRYAHVFPSGSHATSVVETTRVRSELTPSIRLHPWL